MLEKDVYKRQVVDYTNLLKDKSGKVSKVGIVGATKGYGYTPVSYTHLDVYKRQVCKYLKPDPVHA